MSRSLYLGLGFLLLGSACREAVGDPEYPNYPSFDPAEQAIQDPNFFGGAVDFVPGDERFSFGIFYEGPATDIIEIDEVSARYNVFENTLRQNPSGERIEGYQSDEIIINDHAPDPYPDWWGSGVRWETAQDIDDGWTTLRVSMNATDAQFAGTLIRLSNIGVSASTYGFVPDGEWHELEIPLDQFSGLDLTNMQDAIGFGADVGTPDTSILIDDVYLSKE